MQNFFIHGLVQLIGILVITIMFSMGISYLCLYLGILCFFYALLLLLAPVHRLSAFLGYTVLTTITIVIAVIHADNFDRYGPLLRESIDAIFQTNNSEAVHYLTIFSSPIIFPIGIVFLFFGQVTLWRTKEFTSPIAIPASLLVCSAVLIFFGRPVPLAIYIAASDYTETMAKFTVNREAILADLGPIQSDFKGTVVIVIGESIARQHMGIYGYPRRTTASLSAIKDRLTVYRDVISPHSHTTESLSLALTFGTSDRRFATAPDLINVARIAGFKTYWLSNQNSIGVWDNAVGALASQADVIKYHDPSSGIKLTRSVFDEALIASLQIALEEKTSGGKLIFLHLMTAHFPYCNVVPPDFEPDGLQYDDPPLDDRFLGNWLHFLQGDLKENQFINYFGSINCYDRAVSYADKLLNSTIEILAEESSPTALLFLADHGEAVIFNSGHESRLHSHTHVEVPFILWKNKSYIEPLVLDPDRPATLSDLSYSIIQMIGITGISNQEIRSIFSPAYESQARTTLGGRLNYDIYDPEADSVERSRANLRALEPADRERIWAHRMNTLGSLMVSKEFFDGVEMDLVYRPGDRKFSVYHPPVDDVGLNLEAQLQQSSTGLGFWLDWKNASIANVDEANISLEKLNAEYGFKDRTLIEISALDGSARVLSDHGWQVSYYLPTEKILECLGHCKQDEARSLANSLWAQFDLNGYSAISFDIRLLPFIESHMLDRVKHEKIAAHTWATGIDISTKDALALLEPILEREWIKTILVTYPTHFRR